MRAEAAVGHTLPRAARNVCLLRIRRVEVDGRTGEVDTNGVQLCDDRSDESLSVGLLIAT